MRARRVARRAHQAYLVALLYLVADLYRSLREVAVERQEAVAAKSAGCDRCEYPFKTSFHFLPLLINLKCFRLLASRCFSSSKGFFSLQPVTF